MIELTFHPIRTAPLDGSEVWLRNSMLGRPVKGRYTDYTSPWGSVSKQWVLTDDPLGELIGVPAGTRIIPDEWASAETESHKDKPAPDWTGQTWGERYRHCVLALKAAGVLTYRQRDDILKKLERLK